jgi:ferredoxin
LQSGCLFSGMTETVKKKCPDCNFCQMCSEARCRLCRNSKIYGSGSLPDAGFTFSEYEEWQKKKPKKWIPVIDIRRCTGCESCIEVSPQVFKKNMETGSIVITALTEYPEEPVDQAIGICPVGCIRWEDA